MLEAIDKYKFGILAAIASYLVIFSYTNYVTYDYDYLIEPFTETAQIDEANKNEILEITPDNIEIPQDFDVNVRNVSQNVHDDRESSSTDFSQRMSPAQIEQQIQDLESQMKKEAGGSEERARLAGLIEQRKKDREAAAQNNNDGANQEDSNTPTKKYSGETMVSWDLNGRDAYNNTDWYVRNPGYTCDAASGVVVVNVKTNANGDVISAVYNAASSKNATSCMIRKALEYAKLSRFEYNTASNQQSGYIKYTFVLR